MTDWGAQSAAARNQTVFRAEQRAAFIVRRPETLAVVSLITDGYYAPINLGRLWTRHMPGVIEMECDRRRRCHVS